MAVKSFTATLNCELWILASHRLQPDELQDQNDCRRTLPAGLFWALRAQPHPKSLEKKRQNAATPHLGVTKGATRWRTKHHHWRARCVGPVEPVLALCPIRPHCSPPATRRPLGPCLATLQRNRMRGGPGRVWFGDGRAETRPSGGAEDAGGDWGPLRSSCILSQQSIPDKGISFLWPRSLKK